jgi:tetratricopeptide (TPR) repeat protein
VVDRAHNLWLDVGLSSGLAGVLTLGAVLLAFFWLAGRGLRSARDVWTRALWTALLASVIGHLADLHLSFEVTVTASTFWLLLAIAAALGRPGGLPDTEPAVARRQPSRLILALLAIALLTWLPLGVLPLWADAAHWQSQQPARSLPVRLAAAQRAVQLNPAEPAYRLNLAARRLEAADWPAAAAAARQALALAPHDPTLWAALGDLEARWGEQDPAHFAVAAAAYRQALALAPTVAAYHTALGLILVQDGQLAAGTQALQRAVDLDRTDAIAYLYLGDARLTQGQVNDARTAYESAIHWNPDLARAYAGLARCYTQLGDLPAAEAMLARARQLAVRPPTSR